MMDQFDKVCKGLECCLRKNNTNLCGACPYTDGRNSVFACMLSLIRDAQFMIRQQQERIKELEAANASWQKFVPFLYAHGLLNETEGAQK